MAKEKNPAAVALGRLGGLKAGIRSLPAKQRSEIARNAVKERWRRYYARKAKQAAAAKKADAAAKRAARKRPR